MKTWKTEVENLKCGGCESTVKKLLTEVAGAEEVRVFAALGTVEVDYSTESFDTIEAIRKLNKAGYPLLGESNIAHQVKSYISCAKGKLN